MNPANAPTVSARAGCWRVRCDRGVAFGQGPGLYAYEYRHTWDILAHQHPATPAAAPAAAGCPFHGNGG